MIYFCSQKNRRALVLQHPTLNGIDYLEVATEGGNCGKTLVITLLKPAGNLGIGVSNVQITGGASAKAQVVNSVSQPNAASRVIAVELDHSGDFSTYTLALVATPTTSDPPPGLDPQLSTVSFSFKAGCPTIGDCVPDNCCPPDKTPEPDINYLAKDFGGFRQVMLDRMSVLAPGWEETHESDIGVVLVEALAYAADHLSYQQDAVGTEAYIGIARSRISLRRHVKLVDYTVGEGSNARVWVHLNCATDCVFVPAGTMVFPRVSGYPTVVKPESAQATALLGGTLGFATMQHTSLHLEQNEIHLYTWGDSECCLAPGATSATLTAKDSTDRLTTVQPGMVLIFEEAIGPVTGDPADANPKNRWAVRLTRVRNTDFQNHELVDPLTNTKITEVSWAPEDALPFPLCISTANHDNVTLVRGNMVPADHGIRQDRPLPGEIAVIQGSPDVVGKERNFISLLQVGQWLVFAADPSPTFYQISAITDDTHLVLAASYSGTTDLAASAAIVEDLGPVPDPPEGPVTENSCSCNEQSSMPSVLPRYFPRLAASPVTYAFPGIVPLNGTAFVSQSSSTVIGTDTAFSSELQAGQWIVFGSDTTQTYYEVAAIQSNTVLTLTTLYAGVTASGSTLTAVSTTPATQFIAPSPLTARALPQLSLQDDASQVWTVLDDLLTSSDSQRACVLEVERDGVGFLRFGDDQYGLAPAAGTHFLASYRVGNGSVGNIAQESLGHVITSASGIAAVRNPLAAAGGVDSESMDHIRRTAPFAFGTQLRAVTQDDYGVMAQADPAIAEARGTLRWTGSWYTAFVSLDTVDESGPDATLIKNTKTRLNTLRMMGVDLEIEGAVIVGLRIEMNICVKENYFQADVEAALLALFISGNQCSGEPGLLSPQTFTFGETIYISPLIAAAQAVEGVASAVMTVFQRMDDASVDGVAQGYLTMGRLELARCDNDPNRLDHGVFVLRMDGGK